MDPKKKFKKGKKTVNQGSILVFQNFAYASSVVGGDV
jgi:hypothetical protein